jgi:hypothetical protein
MSTFEAKFSARESNPRQREANKIRQEFDWQDNRDWILDLIEHSRLEVIKIRCWFSPCKLDGKRLITPSAFVRNWFTGSGSHMLDEFAKVHRFRPEVV